MDGRSDRRAPLSCPRPDYTMLPICAPLGCAPSPETGKRKETGACNGRSGLDSEGGDVIECVVQLLADGLVLHLLSIDFIWGVRRREGEGAWGRRWREGEGGGGEGDDEMEKKTQKDGQKREERG